ncbi:geraniol 8-hydroxylase-like [Euphorbia lathyris]|uniref:geraniol 8-hydroxylase-like n=1 Tax=Euphorbia lathyris TaxID=212925 RepID=UPI0033144829
MEIFNIYVLTIVLSLGLIGVVSSLFSGKKKLPPGPFPLPIVGNLFQLGKKPHKSLANLAKIHGPLISLKLGQTTSIVISSPSLAKEIFQTHDLNFSDRIISNTFQAHDHHNFSMIFLPVGPSWRNLRKISNSYVFSNHKLDSNQHLRTSKIQKLISYVEQSSCTGKPVEFDQLAFRTSFDVLSGDILSLDMADSKSLELKELVRCIADESVKANLVDYFPLLTKIYPQGLKNRLTVLIGRLFDLFDSIFDERLQAREEQSYISTNDMLDSLFSLTPGNKEHIDRTTIKHLFMDLLTAGTDTTSSTLEWAMAELLRNPGTLRKAREELVQIIGRDKVVNESDVAQLPYLRAIIKETLRLHPAAPLLVPRKAGADVEIGGYIIPKDAQVMVNAWAMGRDPSVWENPELFMPERFLGSAVDARGQHFELIPFGSGRRICPGMPLAIRMLHLMLASLIHRFDWKLEDGVEPESLDMDDNFGTTVHKAQPLRAIPIQLNY